LAFSPVNVEPIKYEEPIMTTFRIASCIAALTAISTVAAAGDGFTKEFPTASCHFSSVGGNPYFPLWPGTQTYFTNATCVAAGKCEELEELWITIENDVKRISLPLSRGSQTVYARVMEERETEDGELKEISRNYLAACLPSRDVYYFGEDVDIYEDGEIVSHDGAWLAGKRGARPGILMPEDGFMLGSRYYQEIAPDVALDRAEHMRAGFSVQLPAGKFDNCLDVDETTPLEPGHVSKKTYCRNVGLVRDGDLELTTIYRRGHDRD
jgi:hypothetical protein